MSKAKNAGTKWDEDDDVPLAQKLKQTAKPAKPAAPPGKSSPAPPRASDSPAASAAGEKQKKDKELKQRAKTKPDPFPVSRSSGKSSAKEGDALAWAKKNWKVLAVVAAGILFFYFKARSSTPHQSHRAHRAPSSSPTSPFRPNPLLTCRARGS